MKKIISFAIALILCFAVQIPVLTVQAYSESSLDCAKKLYDLGLMKGNSAEFSAEGMDLDSVATRAQISVTVTRMLGKDEKANYQNNPHPFDDVPEWASCYVGWLYEEYLINGYSDTHFGSNDKATVKQFCALMLRVLGYYEKNGDFSYDDAVVFAKKIGIVDENIASHTELLRSDMVEICEKALFANLKNSVKTLGVKLLDEKVFSEEKAKRAGISRLNRLEACYADVEKNLPDFAVEKNSDGSYTLLFDKEIEHYGIRVYFTSDDVDSIIAVPLGEGKYFHFEKGKKHYPDDTGAGYIGSVTVYGLQDMENISFMLLKTSSESEIFRISGRSSAVEA